MRKINTIKYAKQVVISLIFLAIAVIIYTYTATRSCDLRVFPILQKPTLPNGCEITALAMVLQHMGFDVEKEKLSDDFLDKMEFYTKDGVRYGGDPQKVFAGNPRDRGGFYCFEQPIIEAANQYLNSVGSDKVAHDITGADGELLRSYLRKKTPVIIWYTLLDGEHAPIYLKEPLWRIEETGEGYTPLSNSHCVVLSGHVDGKFMASDPLSGAISSPISMKCFEEMGSRAVAIY